MIPSSVVRKVAVFAASACGSLIGATLGFQTWMWVYGRIVVSDEDPQGVGLFFIFVPITLFLAIFGGMIGAGMLRFLIRCFVKSQNS